MAGPVAVAAALKAVGQFASGVSSWQASRARAAALKGAAKQARVEGSQAAQSATDEAERTAAAATVIGAASGGGTGGSFAGMLEQLERTGMFNARSAIYAGRVEANNRLYEAKVAKAEGNMELFSAVLGAGSTLAGDYMGQAERRKQEGGRRKLYAMGYGR